jgi:predicted 3-demethylubiquinone-9 3-methyltransferase (glyoxalase superfamily)
MRNIANCLWFNGNGLEAAKFYCSVFKKSKMGTILYTDAVSSQGSGQPVGSVLAVTFWLNGQEFMALNGGPQFKHSEAVSFMVNVDNQKELDYYWKKLTSGGGQEVQCGWLKDKYGLSWQIVPRTIEKYWKSKNAKKKAAMMSVVMDSVKLDFKRLEDAFKNG